MKTAFFHTTLIATCTAALLAGCATGPGHARIDPLLSWNDGSAKQAIIEFVRVTTDKNSSQFVLPEQRIATFDQDRTLWVERPMYSQVVYCLQRVPAVVAAKSESNSERKTVIRL